MSEEIQTTTEQPKLPPNVIPEEGGELFIFARNPTEMAVAQHAQIVWAEHRIELKRKERDELQENLAVAQKNKWRTAPLRNAANRAQKKVEFYEKVRDALKAGYYIIPDMDIDVFAVRTTRSKPRPNAATGRAAYGGPSVRDVDTTSPPSGEGKYVSSRPLVSDEQWTTKEGDKDVAMVTRAAVDFSDVDFPFTFAKADILMATSDALKMKIFDEIGVLPRTRGQDPMVVGNVTYKVSAYQRKRLSFLIAWFIDTKEL